MEKFLKITLSNAPFLIPVKNILHIEVGADTHIQVLYNTVGFGATGASEVIGLQIFQIFIMEIPHMAIVQFK